jgi:hypothetical protein
MDLSALWQIQMGLAPILPEHVSLSTIPFLSGKGPSLHLLSQAAAAI